jgi:sugar (pentulose or hexulose) kinase
MSNLTDHANTSTSTTSTTTSTNTSTTNLADQVLALLAARKGIQPSIVAAEKIAARRTKPGDPTAGVKCLEQMKLACGHKVGGRQ